MKRIILLSGLLAGLLFSGCATTKRSMRLQAKDALVEGRFAEAESKIISPEVLEEEKNRLLTLMDLGTIAHYNSEFAKSNLFFYRAKDLAKELFTVSISEQVATGLLNDNSATYAGMDYEVSSIYYYIVTNYLMMVQEGKLKAWSLPEIKSKKKTIFAAEQHPEKILTEKEKSEFLVRARAEVLAWDTFLETLRHKNRGSPYYKDDLLAKLLAAHVHRLSGLPSERNIAKILYRDAQAMLVKSYSLFPAFNKNNEKYVDGYSKFEALGEKVVQEKFITPTDYYKSLDHFISDRLKATDSGKHRVVVLLETGVIPEKFSKTYTVGLSTLFGQIQDPQLRSLVEQIGLQVVLQTAPVVGVGVVALAATGAVMGEVEGGENRPKHITDAVDKAIGFEFHLPSIARVNTDGQFAIRFRAEDGKEFEAPVVLVNPLNDIAYLDVERRASAMAVKTGIRVGVKYLAVLVAAIQVYKNTPGPDFLKALAGTATWIAGKKIVDGTESPDIRGWATLPMNINMAELELGPGNYSVVLISRKEGATQNTDLGRMTVDSRSGPAIFKRRLFNGLGTI